MNYNIGSIWRKWDLHVHTPESALNNQFGADWDKYVHDLFISAIGKGISVIGITDYYFIDGYKRLMSYVSSKTKLEELFSLEISQNSKFLQKIKNITIFPNIEFRLHNVVYVDGGGDKKLQLHVIFDDKLSITDIEQNFLNLLEIPGECTPVGIAERYLTKENVEKIGEYLKKVQEDGFGHLSKYQAGLNGIAVDFSQVLKLLKNPILEGKYVIISPEDDITKIKWNNQAHLIRKRIYASSNGIFSSNAKTIEWGLNHSTAEEFGGYKPCLWGSDAHGFQDLFEPNDNKYCWIKADTTFEGLLQVFITPNRVYIGQDNPINKIHLRKPNTLYSLEVRKRKDAKNLKKWFDFEIQLNPYLTTIIGNKGSGKSALIDIIAHTLNAKNLKDASFLNKDRFQNRDNKYADDYCSEIKWLDQRPDSCPSLQYPTNEIPSDLIKYLPQKYIETTCNNLGDEFQSEINQVIFTYIDPSIKGDFNNLNQLITSKLSLFTSTLQNFRNELENINFEVIKREDKQSKKYMDLLNFKLQSTNDKIRIHHLNKPKDIAKPNEDSNQKIAQLIDFLDKQYDSLMKSIDGIRERIKNSNEILDDISKVELQSNNIVLAIGNLNKSYSHLASKILLPDLAKPYFQYKLNADEITKRKSEIIEELTELQGLLDDTDVILGNVQVEIPTDMDESFIVNKIESAKSLLVREYYIRSIKSSLIQQTDVKFKEYHGYLNTLKDWNDTLKFMSLEHNNPDSVVSLENELKYIAQSLSTELDELRKHRTEIIQQIYDVYIQERDILLEIIKPIQIRLASLLKDIDDQIAFDVDIVCSKRIKEEILTNVDQRASGFFQGATKGSAALDNLLNEINFGCKEDVVTFANTIYSKVIEDADNVNNILGDKRALFYEQIGSMKYLSVKYALKLGDKNIDQISPGEKGTVLLAFYLALDKGNCPLLIDQPEDNLDNQSVYSQLVPCILEAKKHRQIIVVTHNPNIAIACDSEMIIYSHIDKKTDYIEYVPGSIENPITKKHVIDILEGTEPAFVLRREKYNL
jgi:ABC-type lipoprotein export system ATPase subunit